MMTLIVSDTQNQRTLAYLIHSEKFSRQQYDVEHNVEYIKYIFEELQPVKNSHGTLLKMKPVTWRKYAELMGAKFYVGTSDLFFFVKREHH